MKIVIPARKGSKGLPFKNRKLFRYTADIIPNEYSHLVYVVTDDDEISKYAKSYSFNVVNRPEDISQDTTSTKEVMEYCVSLISEHPSETIVMLYLTYPQRKWKHVIDSINEYNNSNSESLLCKLEISNSPYLMLKEEDNSKGSQLFKHDLFRRQDYPKCFEISHYISIFKSKSRNKLNSNMYNEDTIFFKIPSSVIDVDTQKDIDELGWKI